MEEANVDLLPPACTHSHEKLFNATAKPLTISLTDSLRECKGCMVGKRIRAPIAKQTSNRSDRKVGRDFADFFGEKEFPSLGRKWYAIVFPDD